MEQGRDSLRHKDPKQQELERGMQSGAGSSLQVSKQGNKGQERREGGHWYKMDVQGHG